MEPIQSLCLDSSSAAANAAEPRPSINESDHYLENIDSDVVSKSSVDTMRLRKATWISYKLPL